MRLKFFSSSQSDRLDVTLPKPLRPPKNLKSAQKLSSTVDAKDPLAIGIFYHEHNNLEVAAYYFSISAARL
jgi:hypothetical protein